MRSKGLHILLFAFVFSKLCFGQTTVSYTGMGTITCPAVPASTISPAVSGLTFSQLSRGSGVTCVTAGTGINGSGFNTTLAASLTGNKWYTCSITSDATVSFVLSNISVVSQVSAVTAGNSVSVQYSIGAGAKIPIGSFTPTTGSVAYTITPGTPITVPASSVLNIFFVPNGLALIGTTCRINNATSFNVSTKPETQASLITFPTVYGTSMTTGWTNGNGTNRLVKVNTISSFTAPVDGTTYTANSVYAGSGEQVVYNGTGSSFSVTGLTPGTNYCFMVYEYNNLGGSSPYYNTTTLATNPLCQTTCNLCSSPGDYYRSLVTGIWNTAGNWESSPDNITWITSTLVPTSAAAAVTVLNTHTITVDANASAPTLTINNGGTLEANAASFATLTLIGDLVNNGTVQLVNGTKGVDLLFNKNGNQSISGTGITTNMYSIGLNMGTSRTNILDISCTNFSCLPIRALLFNSSNVNVLSNGTLKFSGSYTFSGPIFQTGASYGIPATTGIWLNNSNVAISSSNDSYDVSGLLRITAGTFNAGSTTGNAIRLLTGSSMNVQGGTVNVSGRLQAANSAGTSQANVTYNQSGGTVTLTTAGQNTSSSIADFYLPLTTDSLIMSGGTVVFTNEASLASDIYVSAKYAITGGTFQISNASTTVATTNGFEMECASTSALPSLLIDNSAGLNPTLYPGTNIKVIGNITINSGTKLNNYWGGSLYYDLSLTGNWNNFGTFIHNNQKTITFNGTSAENITGTSTTNFNNLTINNASGGVTLASPIVLNGTSAILTLTNGLLYTSSANNLAMNANTSATGASNASFVYGPMSKIGSTAFTFPVGKDLQYRPITISALTGSETFTAEYIHADPDAVPYDVTLKDPTLDDIGRCEYWILDRAGSVNAKVALSWNSYSCGVTSLPNLSVAHWDGTMWKDEGNTATTGVADPGTGTVTSGTITSFSPFTLASKTTGVNPLPIELLSLTATYNSSNAVDIKWITASEINNDYFTVERSADAVLFTEFNVTDGAGSSTGTLNYAVTDNEPLGEISYYRLKQTDFDGQYKYSATVSVQKNETGFEIINVYHLSSQNELAVYFNCNSNCLVTVNLYDINGKKVYSSIENTLGKNSEILIPTKNLSEGIYLVKAYNGNQLISKKVKL